MSHTDTSKDYLTRYALAAAALDRLSWKRLPKVGSAMHLELIDIGRAIFWLPESGRILSASQIWWNSYSGEWSTNDQPTHYVILDEPPKCECNDGPFHYEQCPYFSMDKVNPFSELGERLSAQTTGKQG